MVEGNNIKDQKKTHENKQRDGRERPREKQMDQRQQRPLRDVVAVMIFEQ